MSRKIPAKNTPRKGGSPALKAPNVTVTVQSEARNDKVYTGIAAAALLFIFIANYSNRSNESLFLKEIQPNHVVDWSGINPWPSCGRREKEPFKDRPKGRSMKQDIIDVDSQENDEKEAQIVDGVEAKRGEYPWYVQLVFGDRTRGANYCGAALINSRWILTAAHCCIKNVDPKDMNVFVGAIYMDSPEEGRTQVDRCITHPSYKEGNEVSADIALIRMVDELKQPAPEGASLPYNSICLPKYDEFRRNSAFEIAGTGLTGAQTDTTPILKKGLLQAEPKNCSDVGDSKPSGAFYCFKFDRPDNPSTCSGDSGSALMWKSPEDGRVYAVGVTTSALVNEARPEIWCKENQRILAFINVWHFHEWLNKTMIEELNT